MKPDNKFASARASLQDTQAKMASLTRKPTESSTVLAGDVVVTSSEEDLAASIADLRANVRPMPEKVDVVLGYVEQLLRDGELRFTHSQTHATKVTRNPG